MLNFWSIYSCICSAPAFSFGDRESRGRLWHEQWTDAGRPDHPPPADPTPDLHCKLYLNGRRIFRFRFWKELHEEQKFHYELKRMTLYISKIKIFFNFAYECFKKAVITSENANNETISRLVRWAVNSNDWTWMPSYKDLLVYDTGVNKERTLGFEWNSHFNQHCDLVGNLLFCVDFKKINISWRNNQNNQDCLSCFFKIGNVGVFFH